MKINKKLATILTLAGLAIAGPASADLTPFQTFVGNVGYSSDGWGSRTTSSGTISASVPVGSTVLAAFIYTSSYSNGNGGGTLNGNVIGYGAPVPNPTACCNLSMRRADVTGIVKPIIDGGAGGVYNFTVTEDDTARTDGEALVVVYSHPSLPTATFGILDGFSAVGGDTATMTFGGPLDPTAPGFFAEMFLGIGFSCCNQRSNVSVNGTLITQNAGNNDDGLGSISNGQLITVGGFNDPFSAMLPSYAADKERYNLVPRIALGDTQINVRTNNPSNDDNIFLAGFYVKGEATFNPVPEPSTLILFGLGLSTLGFAVRRRRVV